MKIEYVIGIDGATLVVYCVDGAFPAMRSLFGIIQSMSLKKSMTQQQKLVMWQ